MNKRLFNTQQEKEICKIYNKNKLSGYKLAKKFNCSQSTIQRTLKRNSNIRRTISEAKRIYPINEYFFNNLNDPKVIYFIGLLFADGCNQLKNNRSISLSLQEIDVKILEKYRNLIQPMRPLYFIEFEKRYDFYICSKYISQRLNNLGMVPRKSLILKYPKWLKTEEQHRNFIRGYFDGDGSFRYSWQRIKFLSGKFSIAGTFEFLNRVKEIFRNILYINSYLGKVKKCENTWYLEVGGNNQVISLMTWLYYNKEDYYIDRKYNKFKEFEKLYSGGK